MKTNGNCFCIIAHINQAPITIGKNCKLEMEFALFVALRAVLQKQFIIDPEQEADCIGLGEHCAVHRSYLFSLLLSQK